MSTCGTTRDEAVGLGIQGRFTSPKLPKSIFTFCKCGGPGDWPITHRLLKVYEGSNPYGRIAKEIPLERHRSDADSSAASLYGDLLNINVTMPYDM